MVERRTTFATLYSKNPHLLICVGCDSQSKWVVIVGRFVYKSVFFNLIGSSFGCPSNNYHPIPH